MARALGALAVAGMEGSVALARRLAAEKQDAPQGLTALSMAELAARIRRREVTPSDAVDAYLGRIERLDADLHAYVLVTAAEARARAREITAGAAAARRDARDLRLPGIPIAHKDLFDTAGIRTTGGSRLYTDRVPARDAALVARLAEAGAVTLGKTNTHELGGGVTTINPFYGTTRNPHDRERVAGGSSGGSAAAVAAHLAAAATGSDTGGSIRIPAAFCGCVGFKPSFGVLDTAGLLGACPTFDHAGFLARTVGDLSLLLGAAAGADAGGQSTGRVPGTTSRTEVQLRGLRVGVPRAFFLDRLDDDVSRAFSRALGRARDAGAQVREVALPVDESTMARVFDPIVVSEIRATYQAAWRDRPDAFSKDFAAVFSGPATTAEAVATARRALQRFQGDMARVFDEVDVVATPTVPVTAPRIDGPIDGLRILRNTWPFNAARLPALSIPCHPQGGLPVGLQIVGPSLADGRVLAAGGAVAALIGER